MADRDAAVKAAASALRDRYAAWSYRPGWSFDVEVMVGYDGPSILLTVAAVVANSRGPEHDPASLAVMRDVTDVATMQARFVDLLVWEMIDELERHRAAGVAAPRR